MKHKKIFKREEEDSGVDEAQGAPIAESVLPIVEGEKGRSVKGNSAPADDLVIMFVGDRMRIVSQMKDGKRQAAVLVCADASQLPMVAQPYLTATDVALLFSKQSEVKAAMAQFR